MPLFLIGEVINKLNLDYAIYQELIILMKTKKKLEKMTIQFLKIAEKHNLCFKQSKYDFNAEEIPILEIVVERRKVQMENNKVKVVKK